MVHSAAIAHRSGSCITPSSNWCSNISPGGFLLAVLSIVVVISVLLVVLVVVVVVVDIIVIVRVVVVVAPAVIKLLLVVIASLALPAFYFSFYQLLRN